ncbi:hypothetical protein QVD17_19359 [Tagetes erecta]|uniref:Uncharacterized protein n=1 Tax=Tagetes erecta TaxID=13708 RepID=A0AAD8KJL8_TARER|nr:hypothetical protein QVD17_19359 [Tagetes erecta]
MHSYSNPPTLSFLPSPLNECFAGGFEAISNPLILYNVEDTDQQDDEASSSNSVDSITVDMDSNIVNSDIGSTPNLQGISVISIATGSRSQHDDEASSSNSDDSITVDTDSNIVNSDIGSSPNLQGTFVISIGEIEHSSSHDESENEESPDFRGFPTDRLNNGRWRAATRILASGSCSQNECFAGGFETISNPLTLYNVEDTDQHDDEASSSNSDDSITFNIDSNIVNRDIGSSPNLQGTSVIFIGEIEHASSPDESENEESPNFRRFPTNRLNNGGNLNPLTLYNLEDTDQHDDEASSSNSDDSITVNIDSIIVNSDIGSSPNLQGTFVISIGEIEHASSTDERENEESPNFRGFPTNRLNNGATRSRTQNECFAGGFETISNPLTLYNVEDTDQHDDEASSSNSDDNITFNIDSNIVNRDIGSSPNLQGTSVIFIGEIEHASSPDESENEESPNFRRFPTNRLNNGGNLNPLTLYNLEDTDQHDDEASSSNSDDSITVNIDSIIVNSDIGSSPNLQGTFVISIGEIEHASSTDERENEESPNFRGFPTNRLNNGGGVQQHTF